jgi:phage recombination protein Bet
MAAPASAVDPVVAEAMTMSARLAPLRNALGLQDFTDQELDLFAMVALRMRLDPFQKQIYAVKRQGKVTFQTGIDGFRSSAEETDQYRGSDEPEYGPMVGNPPHPEWAKVVVHRELPDGARISQSATAYWDEYVVTGSQGFQWTKMPRVMLAKCAEAAAFRKAFPKRFAQAYEPAEMQQADAVAQATPVAALTHRDRIAAERAALESPTTSAAPATRSADTRPVQAEAAVRAAPDAAAPTPAPDAASPADGVGDAVTDDGEIIEGTAVDVTDASEGLNAGELRDALRAAFLSLPDTMKHARATYGDKATLDSLTPAQRAEVLAVMKAAPR